MFVVEVTALAVTIIIFRDLFTGKAGLIGFELQIAIWLWFTVLFANFAEAMAEGRGKAQADNLRKTRVEMQATIIRDGKEETVRRHHCAEATWSSCARASRSLATAT